VATQEIPHADTGPIDLGHSDDPNVVITRDRLAELMRRERQHERLHERLHDRLHDRHCCYTLESGQEWRYVAP